ncbi:MAG: Gfo/Idh/MocA family oxidoreductase [Bacteroidetes bacterium]|nr:Gfo/Idh/MocA family oxidoreductase [Bacteroidales bacterium]MBU1009775.1 Gfo/Idh/MocA family oxidoreductase [Bacteroidota bacterium]
MLKIGVLGAGHLGKIHIKCIKQIPEYELVGFFDTDPVTAEKVSQEFGLKRFDDISSLISAVDVVDIVTPTISHFPCASESLRKSKHVFIEKPIVATPAEANALMELAKEARVKVQVGHVERFNPAFMAAQASIKNPMFIETHRLAQFNPRGTDVPVILDLMVHDIDIILSVVKSPIRKISASGVSIVSDTPDITNARIEFDNGCVANLTASRISMKNMRKSRFFQKDAYITVDFLEKKAEIVRMKDLQQEPDDPMAMVIDLGNNKGMKQIIFEKPDIQAVNAIMLELESFYHAIANNQTPPVTIEDGYNVLSVAYQILDKVNANAGMR